MSCLRSICVLLIALCSGAFAQTATSVIFGTVTDASGSAVPNVPVTATATATGVSTRVVTNESGNYVFPNLQPGTYCGAGFTLCMMGSDDAVGSASLTNRAQALVDLRDRSH